MPGLPNVRITHALEIDALRCPAHHKRMITMAWNLGAQTSIGDPPAPALGPHPRLRRPPLTKSRRYSVTFGHIRGERVTQRRLERPRRGT